MNEDATFEKGGKREKKMIITKIKKTNVKKKERKES